MIPPLLICEVICQLTNRQIDNTQTNSMKSTRVQNFRYIYCTANLAYYINARALKLAMPCVVAMHMVLSVLTRYAAKHERKSQYANLSGLPAVSFLHSGHSIAPEVTKQFFLMTFNLVQNDAY